MKKIVLVFMFIIIASITAWAQGFYFDVGTGFVLGGQSFSYESNRPSEKEDIWGIPLGVKMGYGPFGNVPVYVVGEFDYTLFSDGILGVGVLCYPHRLFQLGASLGITFPTPELSISHYSYDGRGYGFAWNISAALDLGKRNNGWLLGLKLSNSSSHVSYDGSIHGIRSIVSFGVLAKYRYRTRTLKEREAFAAEDAMLRRDRMFEDERQRQIRQMERDQIQREVRAELQSAYPGIDNAVGKAGQTLVNALPEESRVAVINITSNDRGISAYVAEDIEYQLVNSGKFIIVDRNRLETIRAEQNLQMSGDVSDESAVSIGKMLGANIILTGSISEVGANRRLSIRAIDVETTEVVTMVRQDF